ncbi:transposase [Mesorhizobium sp.]|uniref:transposase n=1 Tax=Mesorhizobium sp. TaxID=1871066 RepID=UPI0025B90316|nr:transposase [Mesorhizobium sp.]
MRQRIVWQRHGEAAANERRGEAAAFEHIEGMLWPQGPVCPKCGSMDKHYKVPAA